MVGQLARVLSLGLLSLASAGCVCVQGMPGGAVGPAGCSTGMCGTGPLMGLASCRGACGEVYVDEWISEPPVVDACGPACGGCQRCYQPLRNALRMLWGRPYTTCCPTGLVGPSCESGCDSYGGEFGGWDDGQYVSESYGDEMHHSGYGHSSTGRGCNCGQDHPGLQHAPSTMGHPMPAPALPGTPKPAAPLPNPSGNGGGAPKQPPAAEAAPEEVTPTSAARRLNPALSRYR